MRTFIAILAAVATLVTSIVGHASDTSHFKALMRRQQNATSWPYGPFRTRGRDIVNARGEVVTWAGVNWPLSGESMIPEGLEWAGVDEILNRVASVGFNFIRMFVLLLILSHSESV